MSNDPSNEQPGQPDNWLGRAREKGNSLLDKSILKKWAKALKKRLPEDLRNLSFEEGSFSQYSPWILRGLVVLGIFLAAELAGRIAGSMIRPTLPTVPKKAVAVARRTNPIEDYEGIIRRNMFNVEGKIPDIIDQGQLDCFSQAKPSTQRMSLLGTIVMNDDVHSVALMQDENNPVKLAVSKDEVFFDGKYQMNKIERKKICFTVRATQDMEFIEIPDDSAALGTTSLNSGMGASDGIQPVSENEFKVKQNFLEKNLLNLNEILQTARAVPYVEPGTGKFKGFLIQSIDANSPFAQLGIKQGDILTGVNDIVLDNAGKGLEAFQRLRNSPKVSLTVIRGGESRTVTYDVN